MTITIRAPLNDFAYNTTLFHFNTHCPPNMELKLISNKKGFSLEITPDDGGKQVIKTIRKHGNMVLNCFNEVGFNEEEETLLYRSLCAAIGHKNVNYYPSLSIALDNSPSAWYSLTMRAETEQPLRTSLVHLR